jgi:hypothetical protein
MKILKEIQGLGPLLLLLLLLLLRGSPVLEEPYPPHIYLM